MVNPSIPLMKSAKNSPSVTNVWTWTLLVLVTQNLDLTDGVNDETETVSLTIWSAKMMSLKDPTTDVNDTLANVTESWPLVWVTPGCCGTNLITLDGVDLTEKPTVKPIASDVCPKTIAAVPTVKLPSVIKTPSLDDLMLPPLPLLDVVVILTITLLSTMNVAWTEMVISLSPPKTLAQTLLSTLIPLMNSMRTSLVIPESKGFYFLEFPSLTKKLYCPIMFNP
jgi:hypothetical protein